MERVPLGYQPGQDDDGGQRHGQQVARALPPSDGLQQLRPRSVVRRAARANGSAWSLGVGVSEGSGRVACCWLRRPSCKLQSGHQVKDVLLVTTTDGAVSARPPPPAVQRAAVHVLSRMTRRLLPAVRLGRQRLVSQRVWLPNDRPHQVPRYESHVTITSTPCAAPPQTNGACSCVRQRRQRPPRTTLWGVARRSRSGHTADAIGSTAIHAPRTEPN